MEKGDQAGWTMGGVPSILEGTRTLLSSYELASPFLTFYPLLISWRYILVHWDNLEAFM